MITDLVLYIQTNLSNKEQIILVALTMLITLALFKLYKITENEK